MFFLTYDKNISFLSAEGSFWIGNFVCGEVKNVGILAYSEAFDEMARKIYIQKPVDLYGATPLPASRFEHNKADGRAAKGLSEYARSFVRNTVRIFRRFF